MSRLDRVIRRLQAQRACLDQASDLVRSLPGPILELGLGNGRTFDHLRESMPEREIFVFDRRVASHPSSTPDEAYMILGELEETLGTARDRIGSPAAMAHCDIGSGRAETTNLIVAVIEEHLTRLLAPGAIVVSDQALDLAGSSPLPLPDGVKPDRYYMYRLAENGR